MRKFFMEINKMVFEIVENTAIVATKRKPKLPQDGIWRKHVNKATNKFNIIESIGDGGYSYNIPESLKKAITNFQTKELIDISPAILCGFKHAMATLHLKMEGATVLFKHINIPDMYVANITVGKKNKSFMFMQRQPETTTIWVNTCDIINDLNLEIENLQLVWQNEKYFLRFNHKDNISIGDILDWDKPAKIFNIPDKRFFIGNMSVKDNILIINNDVTTISVKGCDYSLETEQKAFNCAPGSYSHIIPLSLIDIVANFPVHGKFIDYGKVIFSNKNKFIARI